MTPRLGRLLLPLAATASLLAGALHAAVAVDHFREWWGYGAFFVLASTAQALYGLVLFALPAQTSWKPAEWLAWTRRLFWAGILLNAATLALYVVTRTVGIPLGPSAGVTEPVGAIDLASKATEAVLIVLLAILLRASPWPSAEPEGLTALHRDEPAEPFEASPNR